MSKSKQASLTLATAIAALSKQKVTNATKKIEAAFAERIKFEKDNGATENKIAGLEKNQRHMMQDTIASVFAATEIDPGFVNVVSSGNSRFNVYGVDKMSDILSALAGGKMSNAVNIAVMKSLFAFRAANQAFNMEHAQACVSKNIKVASKDIEKLLIRHTTSPTTANTQASSTMRALEFAGVVERLGKGKNATFALTESPQTEALETLLAA